MKESVTARSSCCSSSQCFSFRCSSSLAHVRLWSQSQSHLYSHSCLCFCFHLCFCFILCCSSCCFVSLNTCSCYDNSLCVEFLNSCWRLTSHHFLASTSLLFDWTIVKFWTCRSEFDKLLQAYQDWIELVSVFSSDLTQSLFSFINISLFNIIFLSTSHSIHVTNTSPSSLAQSLNIT